LRSDEEEAVRHLYGIVWAVLLAGAIVPIQAASPASAASFVGSVSHERSALVRIVDDTASVVVLAAIAPPRAGWSPICAAFDEGSFEWYLFGCFIDPPPKEPRT
jgi:hypothetical protein